MPDNSLIRSIVLQELASRGFPQGAATDTSLTQFGADPLGIADSHDALQAAVDSDLPVLDFGGYYYNTAPILIDKPKIILMRPGLLQPWDTDPRRRASRGPGPNIEESHTRIWTDRDINMFEIRSPNVYFVGGTFDFQAVPQWSKACFYYPGSSDDHNDRANGWGGGAEDFRIVGSFLDLVGIDDAGDPTGLTHTGKGIHFDFQSPDAILNAYWTHMRFRGLCFALAYGLKAEPRNPALSHWANTLDCDLELRNTQRAVYNECFSGSRFRIKHQGAYCFNSQAEADAASSIYSTSSITLIDPDFFDFGEASSDVTGNGDIRWYNKYSIDIPGPSQIEDASVNTLAKKKYLGAQEPFSAMENMIGFLPHTAITHGMVISELHNILWDQILQGTYTVVPYKGNEAVDLTTLEVPAAGTSTVSGDITINSEGNFVKFLAQYESATIAQQAADDGDFIEQVLTIPGIALKDVWVTFDGNPSQIQLLLLEGDDTVIHNQTLNLRDEANAPSGYRFVHFDTDYIPTCEKIIIRYIGFYSAGTLIPHEVCGTDNKQRKPSPFVHLDGGQTVYGSFTTRDNLSAGNESGAWDEGHLTIGSYHLWVDSTGDLRIKSSAPTSDTDGTVVGSQS